MKATHSILALAALATWAPAQRLVVPDNMNLGSTVSSTLVWRSVAGRFQAAYDSTHFTNAGVTGPILITRLRFRAEDSQPDPGGHVFTGVSVEVGDCAVDHAALSSTFATNRGPMGSAGLTSVSVGTSTGAVPNNYIIDLDLVALGATWLYDPTLGADLLIDINYSAPTPTTNLPPISVGSSTVATARSRMCYGTQAGLTGTLTGPPTILVDFTGGGGYATPQPATTEAYGYGCASTYRSFYQDFLFGDLFDLAGTSLTLTPDNVAVPTYYTVTAGAAAPDVTQLNATPNSITDDAVVTHALGFTHNYPGNSTTTVKPSTNGFVWLDSTMTSSDNSPTPPELLGTTLTLTARHAPLWFDFHPGRNTVTNPNSGLHVLTNTSGGAGNAVCYVTWFQVGIFNSNAIGGASVNTMQLVIHEATGVIEYRYGAMNLAGIPVRGIVGWSPGRVGGVGAQHPGPRNLSHEVPFATAAVDGSAAAISLNIPRPIGGTPFTMSAFNSPATTAFGAFLLALAMPQQPAIWVAPLDPGCGVSLPLANVITYQLVIAPANPATSLPLTIPPGYEGMRLLAQYATLDTSGVVYTSHGRRLVVGLN